jgi:hypothetical protein
MAGLDDRRGWVARLTKMADPVLRAFAARNCKATMPVEGEFNDKRYGGSGRREFSHLEALGRTMVGIAPWLECAEGLEPAEEALRAEYAGLARAAIDAATDPASPDLVNWGFSYQPIVDAAFLAHAILRAPNELWRKLDARVQANVVTSFVATRSRRPHFNNWLLFSAMIEACLAFAGAQWDHQRVDFALRQHAQWYKGDGVYGDGADFHWDYYNSLVIQPMLLDVLATVGDSYPDWAAMRPDVLKRARRYGEVLERMISPEGTYPPLGRSLAYRCGAFQHLAQMALQHQLTPAVTPGQARCGLTAVIARSLDAPGTYDAAGWLTIGFAGHQPEVGEMYISTGSLYLASTAFLPLGLPPSDPFWADAPAPWTGKRMWGGGAAPLDHALDHDVI